MTKRDLLAFALRLLGGLRTTWLILGVTLGLFLGVEAVYRAIRRVAHPTVRRSSDCLIDWARLVCQ